MNIRTAEAVLNESYLETRAKLLEVAAVLDRIDRSVMEGDRLPPDQQAARGKLTAGIELLLKTVPNRAELIQQLFSHQYDPNWRSGMGLPPTQPTSNSPKRKD